MLKDGFIAREDFERFSFPSTVGDLARILEEGLARPASPQATAPELARA